MTNLDIVNALNNLTPGASWTLNGDTLAGLQWLDGVIARPSDAAILAAIASYNPLTKVHATAVAVSVSGADPVTTLQRAAALVIMDQLNILRQRDADNHTDVANATTLADLKTRWAARSALPQITAPQIVTAIQAKINAGSAD